MKHFKTMGKTQLLLKKKTSTILAFFFVVASGQIFPQSLNGGKGKQLFGIFKKETAVCSPMSAGHIDTNIPIGPQIRKDNPLQN